jgi:two-component system NarL family response regulator
VKTIRIVIADDHELYRRGMEAVIGVEPDLEIVGEAATAADVVDEVVRHEPDVVLLEVRLGGQSGIDACTAIKMSAPRTKVLVLTASDDEADLFKALMVGASGYLVKSLPVDQVVEAIRLAHAGEVIVPPPMARHLVEEFSRLVRRSSRDVPSEREPERERRLTDREREVLSRVAQGKPNREIATELFVSENTVKNHVRNIMGKLQASSRTEAAMHAVRENLITLDG